MLELSNSTQECECERLCSRSTNTSTAAYSNSKIVMYAHTSFRLSIPLLQANSKWARAIACNACVTEIARLREINTPTNRSSSASNNNSPNQNSFVCVCNRLGIVENHHRKNTLLLFDFNLTTAMKTKKKKTVLLCVNCWSSSRSSNSSSSTIHTIHKKIKQQMENEEKSSIWSWKKTNRSNWSVF